MRENLKGRMYCETFIELKKYVFSCSAICFESLIVIYVYFIKMFFVEERISMSAAPPKNDILGQATLAINPRLIQEAPRHPAAAGMAL